MKLLCDEMLSRLARWLRAAGHDAALVARGTDDPDVAAQALREDRVLLTCDRELARRKRGGLKVLLLSSNRPEECARELVDGLGLDWRAAPWSRCLDCNVPIEEVNPHEAPPAGYAPPAEAPRWRCPACGRWFWEGSHARRFERRLALALGEE